MSSQSTLPFVEHSNRKMAQAAPAAALVLENGYPRYVLSNAAAQQLLGYSRDELLRMGLHDIVAAGQEDTLISARRTLRDTGYWRDDLRLRRKDGTVVPVEVTATRIGVGEREVYLCLFRDSTAREQTEEAGAA